MTLTDATTRPTTPPATQPATRPTTPPVAIPPLVALDLYRDIHKGIRTELFAVTAQAGRVDPADDLDVRDLAAQVAGVVDVLVLHAEHEDGHIQPTLEQELPALAQQIADEHDAVERTMGRLVALADQAASASVERRATLHALYLDLSTFTATYLEHQDVEERVVMPALQSAIGVEAVAGIHQAIIGSIPPDEMARSLAFMLPAMNLDDRVELLGGMRAGAPAEVFDGVWSLAGSVLRPTDVAALGSRLGLA